jgi:hypothetical protein
MASLTVALSGGLGNQMFQYAMGRALTLRHDLELRLDLYGFEFDTFHRRKFELGHFSIPPGLRYVRSPIAFTAGRLLAYLSRIRKEVAALGGSWLIVEPSLEFDLRQIQRTPAANAYLFGYWQDARYFADIAATIQKEFTLASELSPANQAVDARIRSSSNPVAVHVRRLHQVASKPKPTPMEDAETKGLALSASYYNDAIREIEQRVSDPEYFVFSDYPQWARENLTFDGNDKLHVFENDRGPDYEDMALMSHCKHHVVANSSFSWWGAWLGRSQSQIAVAPRNAKLMPNFPSEWIQI